MKPSTFFSTGQVSSFSKSLDSVRDALELFDVLGQQQNTDNMMLLESCDVKSIASSQDDTKSIMMLQAAIRIECNDNKIVLNALNANGVNALLIIQQYLQQFDFYTIDEQSALNKASQKKSLMQLCCTLKTRDLNEAIDEDQKLKRNTPIDILRLIQSAFKQFDNEYSVFLCGLFSFDLIASTEKISKLKTGNNTAADFIYYLAEKLVVIDHKKNQQRLICNHFTSQSLDKSQTEKTYFQLAREFEALEAKLNQLKQLKPQTQQQNKSNANSQRQQIDYNQIQTDISNADYQAVVTKLKQNIVDGDIFQVVPARTFSMPCLSPFAAYQALKQSNPSPYLFYMQDQDFTLFGASPESALKYTAATNQVELYPIAGTRPRGKKANGEIDLDLDIRLEAELKLDQKEVSEHIMLVDLARNDIARIADAGSIHVNKFLDVDRYSQVMHLVSTVVGQLQTELDAIHAYKACMNMGTLTGAPKIKATELLRSVEKKRRGSYGGAIGYLNANGDMDTCIVIRSAFCTQGMAHVQAGAGIVFDSCPKAEAAETEAKAKAVLLAIQNSQKELVQ